MCRHLAYVGPPVALTDLLIDRPHALLVQSWAPAYMRGGGTVNADGFGAGWYSDEGADPIRYRRAVPMWTDPGFADLARSVRTGAALAAVRSATTGMPVIETACAPFTGDGWLFSHNGLVRGWPHSMVPAAEQLPTADLLTLDAPTDSALLWALLRHRLRTGEKPERALAELVTEVASVAPNSRLNLLLTNGRTIYATAWQHALSVLPGPDSVVVASEPWDTDPRWRPVPDQHLLVGTPDGIELHDLDGPNEGAQR